MLTKVGRLVAVSATDGVVQWAEYLGTSPNQKIIVRTLLERELASDAAVTQQIVAISDDTIYTINPANGEKGMEYYLAPLTAGLKRDFLLVSVGGESKAQFVLAITNHALAKGEPLVMFPPEEFSSAFLENENVYFTHADKSKGLISGYRLRKDLVAVKIWSLNLDKQSEFILKLETQLQTASSIDHLHFTPTAFSGENIIYKHLDSNVFCLITRSKDTSLDGGNEVIVYLINGVSGRVLHRYVERKVRLDLPFDIVLSENMFVFAFQR
jgi:hypothetical protein